LYDQVAALVKLQFGGSASKQPLNVLAKTLGDEDFCYAVLNKVSRSFALVIQQLPKQLKGPVCIFYLVLRGLDSVEDDMTYPNTKKVPLLMEFHNFLEQDGWNIDGVGDSADYRILLANFQKVIAIYKTLEPSYRLIIKDITCRMGKGMADFAKTTSQGLETVESYNLYCHYVAGLVGHGLSALFSESKLEVSDLKDQLVTANSMGLLLQKTNIIRDYHEDLCEGRKWWPREVWSQYADSFDAFRKHPTDAKSLACLNHLVTDALEHVTDCLNYLGRIKTRKVFEFCAIPQVMSMATLSKVYNNSKVFRGAVKIRKGLTARMALQCNCMENVQRYFYSYVCSIESRIPSHDASARRTKELCNRIKELCYPAVVAERSAVIARTLVVLAILVACIAHLYMSFQSQSIAELFVRPTDILGMLLLACWQTFYFSCSTVRRLGLRLLFVRGQVHAIPLTVANYFYLSFYSFIIIVLSFYNFIIL